MSVSLALLDKEGRKLASNTQLQHDARLTGGRPYQLGSFQVVGAVINVQEIHVPPETAIHTDAVVMQFAEGATTR